MACSDFAVIRKQYTQENKEIFMNIFTGLIPPIYSISPQYKNFLVPLKTSDKGNIFTNILYSGASSNTGHET